MATLTLPTSIELSVYSMTLSLDGRDFRFDFTYNSREEFWYFDIYDASGVAIRHGIKAVSDFPLTRLLQGERPPPGEFAVIDATGSGLAATRNNLGSDFVLVYIEGADFRALVG